MKVIFEDQSGNKIHVNINIAYLKATNKKAWIKEVVKAHENMGIDLEKLETKLTEIYDSVCKKKAQ